MKFISHIHIFNSPDYLKNTDCLNATKKDLDVCTHDVIENFMLVPKTKKPEWIPLSCW